MNVVTPRGVIEVDPKAADIWLQIIVYDVVGDLGTAPIGAVCVEKAGIDGKDVRVIQLVVDDPDFPVRCREPVLQRRGERAPSAMVVDDVATDTD